MFTTSGSAPGNETLDKLSNPLAPFSSRFKHFYHAGYLPQIPLNLQLSLLCSIRHVLDRGFPMLLCAVASDSTLVYQRMTDGLVTPDPPVGPFQDAGRRQHRKRRQQRWAAGLRPSLGWCCWWTVDEQIETAVGRSVCASAPKKQPSHSALLGAVFGYEATIPSVWNLCYIQRVEST